MTLTPPPPSDDPSPRSGRGRRTAAVVAAGVGVVAVVGGGALAWQFWSAQGPQPSEALPGNTLAYVAVDLDPPGGQKLAAYDALRKFPSVKKDWGLDDPEDLGRAVLEGIAEDGACDLDWGEVKAWAGDRLAFAVVPQDEPEPVLVAQVDDATRATAALDRLGKACTGEEFGFAVHDGWAVLARSGAVARQVVADAASGTLAEDGDFEELTGAAGDAGVMTLYAAPEAGDALLAAVEDDPWGGYALESGISWTLDPIDMLLPLTLLLGDDALFVDDSVVEDSVAETDMEFPAEELLGREPTPEEERLIHKWEHIGELPQAEQEEVLAHLDELMRSVAPEPDEVEGGAVPDGELVEDDLAPELSAEMRTALEEFTGIGGVVRLRDDAVEAEVVADPLVTGADLYAGGHGGRDAARLPADSALASGADLAPGWADAALRRLGQLFGGFGEPDGTDATAAFEEATGLRLPEDLEALGGDGVAVVSATGFEPWLMLDPERERGSLAVRVTGDARKIEAALDRMRAKLGSKRARSLLSRPTSDGVVIGPDADYLEAVADPGSTLGDTARFRRAVPHAEGATSVTYVDFDKGGWPSQLFLLEMSEGDRSGAKPLDTAGISVSEEGQRSRLVLRLTLD